VGPGILRLSNLEHVVWTRVPLFFFFFFFFLGQAPPDGGPGLGYKQYVLQTEAECSTTHDMVAI
jgi:hypothetical protein